MALDARYRSSIYQKLVGILGDDDTNALMTQYPSIEADELVTKQFLRAELAETLDATIAAMDARFVTKDLLRAELAEQRSWMEEQLHRQTLWLGSGLAGATALLAALGALT